MMWRTPATLLLVLGAAAALAAGAAQLLMGGASGDAFAANGSTYYVGQAGCSDTGPGDGQTPFCSFATALGHLTPGDTLVIKAGTYTERLVANGLAGQAGSPIVVRGESRDTAIFDGGCPSFPCGINDVTWGEDEEAGMVSIRDSSFVTLRDVTVQNAIAAGVDVVGGSDIVAENIVIDGTGNAGLLFRQTSNLIVRGNDIGNSQQGWRDEMGAPHAGAHESLSVVAVSGFDVANNHVHDTLKEAIDVKESSTNGEVHDNFVERACGLGIYINEAQNVKVYRNEIWHSGYFAGAGGQLTLCSSHPVFGPQFGQYYGAGILLAVGDLGDRSRGSLSNVDVYQNVVWDAHEHGLSFWDELVDSGTGEGQMTDNSVHNNVFYQVALDGIRLDDVEGTVVANNVIALTGQGSITGNSTASSTISHNLFYQGQGGGQPVGTDYVVGAPLFVDPANGDFHLREGSPAIDAGRDVGLAFVGSAPDIGAFEFGAAPAPGPVPAPMPLPECPGGTECLPLTAGVCQFATWTGAGETSPADLAARVRPEESLVSLWAQQPAPTWRGYSAEFPQVSDLEPVSQLDVVAICVGAPGEFLRPVV